MARIPTVDLVNKIFAFCQAYSGVEFFPYQAQFAKRIIRSVLENDGEEITALFSRQSGKSETVATISGGLAIILPILANTPMFENDPRLEGFKKGFMIGIFAPTLRQAQISFNRMKKRMSSQSAQEVMGDPEVDVQFDISNGQNIILSNGSLICCQSASDGSNIEGDSYMMILVDEAQDVGNFKYLKSISPMGAFYNATKILIGTSTTHKGFFFDSINRNNEEHQNGGKRNHFEYDYHTVIKYNPKYEKYVAGEKKRQGENSDEFQMAFCVAPETKILTADLRWIRADEVKKGDSLVGFDEEPPKKYGQRKFKNSIVEDVGVIQRPCYQVSLSDGSSIVCSSEHQWLVFTAGSRTQWKMTKDLVGTDRIYKVCDVWNDLPQDYKLGYLSASFDGEGNLGLASGKLNQVSFAQKSNSMLDTVTKYLKDSGFEYNSLYASGVKNRENAQPVYRLNISGGKREYMRFLGSVRPKRLLDLFNPDMLGTVRCTNGESGSDIHPRVNSIKYLGKRNVIPIRTSTRTYVAEGLASHNCLKWILERGMFFDPKLFDKMKESSLGLSIMDTSKMHVAGIDLGKKSDSTVVTILEVDWDNPVIVEKSHSGDVDVPDYIGYNTVIKSWLEIQGDDWDSQYSEIMSFLSNFNVVRIVMDGTGVGDAIYDRMRANLDIEVVPYVFSRQSKSELYKHLNAEVRGGRVHYPADEETQNELEYEKFCQQCMDLEKSYSGQLMVVAHPMDVQGAHDDYPDSLALAVWGARGEGVSRPTTENGSFYPKSERSVTHKVNRLTAKRRR